MNGRLGTKYGMVDTFDGRGMAWRETIAGDSLDGLVTFIEDTHKQR